MEVEVRLRLPEHDGEGFVWDVCTAEGRGAGQRGGGGVIVGAP